MKTMMAIFRIADIRDEYVELRNQKLKLESEYSKIDRLYKHVWSDRCMAAKWGNRDEWSRLAGIMEEYDIKRCEVGAKINALQLKMYALEHDYTVLVNRHKLIEIMDYPYNVYDF